MSFLLGGFIYLLIWWVTLFMILPLGVRSHQDKGKGHDDGAPTDPQLKKKLILNTIISALILAILVFLVKIDFIQWHLWFNDDVS